ncbi:MAG: hypothetical protein A2W26_01080, partial [Acidobacteria bacterium RBG_16_64_8]
LDALKPSTRRAYQKGLMEFATFLGLPDAQSAAAHIASLTHGEANSLAFEYRSMLIKRGLENSTVNARMAALKFGVKLARIMGYISWSLDVQNLKVEAYRDTSGPGWQTVLDVDRALVEKSDPVSVRNRAILNMIFNQGLRRGELVSLDLSHVEFDKNRVMILGKARGGREGVTLTPGTIETLKGWIAVRGERPGPLFQSLDRHSAGGRLTGMSIYRIIRDYGLERPHGVRHSAITDALDKSGGDLRAVMRFSRHKDPKVLMKYDDNRQDLAGKMANLIDLNKKAKDSRK